MKVKIVEMEYELDEFTNLTFNKNNDFVLLNDGWTSEYELEAFIELVDTLVEIKKDIMHRRDE
jgi:hypothetical protein